MTSTCDRTVRFVEQWIVRDGEFDLDLTKLSPGLTPDNARPPVDQHFRDIWGVSLDNFVLLSVTWSRVLLRQLSDTIFYSTMPAVEEAT